MCFFNSAEKAYLNKMRLFHLEISDLQRYSTEKLIQMSQGNNVLGVGGSNADGCHLRNTCFPSTQLKRPLRNKLTFSTLKILLCMKYSFPKITQFSLGNNVLDAAASNIDCVLWRDTCVSSIQLRRNELSPHRKF
jgi:hypothetical protein